MDKRKMPTRKDVNTHHGRDENDGTCMACERPAILLHRAHIQAHHCGGSDKPENIHLLCRACHAESEYLSGDVYQVWFNAIKDTDYCLAKYQVAIYMAQKARERGLDRLEQAPVDSEELRKFVSEFMPC